MSKIPKETANAVPQPPPSESHLSVPVIDLVQADLLARKEMGLKKYGTVLKTHNGRDALTDFVQEQLDGLMYIRQLQEEMKALSGELHGLVLLTADELENCDNDDYASLSVVHNNLKTILTRYAVLR